MRAVSSALLLAAICATCGGEATVLVDVDLSRLAVPTELDLVHAEISDKEGVFVGRNVPLTDGQTELTIEFIQGPRTPDALTLIVYGYLQSVLVTESEPQSFTFEAGKEKRLKVRL